MEYNHFLKPLRHLTLAASVIVLFSACATTIKKPNKNGLTDANIAAIVMSANTIDISAGKIALDRSNNKKIKVFASRMITDHNAVLNYAIELVTELEITPANNALVSSLSEQSKSHEAKLKTLNGHEFNMTYINHEIVYHKTVIDVLEELLIPGAFNQKLKDALNSVVPAFKAHLAHSKMIKESL